jgi:lytic murein transglycosylase
MALRVKTLLLALSMLAGAGVSANAAECGSNSSGFEAWKSEFTQEAAAQGVGRRALNALANTSYQRKTIAADRGQHSFKLSLDDFMQKRGANTIISRGKAMKRQNAELFANIERRYGVPAGPLIAIWGMETGFGSYMGNSNILSAVATLAYDCRRSDYFTGHLYAALDLIARGSLSPQAIGAAHGEIGQTQFLPGNALKYGVDADGNGSVDLIHSRADALATTANYLRAHGWVPGAGYQPGQPNFNAIQEWNAATVYQKAIAIIAAEIDGG